MAIPTQSQIADLYLNTILALNPDQSVNIVGEDWWIKAQVIGGIAVGLYADQYNYSLNIFPQNSAGELVSRHLATWNLPPKQPAFPSTGTMFPTSAPTSDVTLAAGTQVNYSAAGLSYTTTEQVLIASGTQPQINIQCTITGAGTQLSSGVVLTPNSPISGITSFTVEAMVDGSDVEDDAQAINRVLQRIQTPAAGGTVGDYYRWAATTVLGVPDALIEPGYGHATVVGVFLLAGGFDIDSILANPGIPLNRQATQDQIDAVAAYIETVRPATDSYLIGTVATYQIPAGVINVQVSLANGLTLGDIIPAVGLTALDLIKREVRRAVLLTPAGGYVVNGTRYLQASEIAQTLDVGLSANPNELGLYASLLTDRQVTLTGGTPNFILPNSINISGVLPFVYDVPYANIVVSTF